MKIDNWDELVASPPLIPCGNILLVRTVPVEQYSDSGIVLMTDNEKGREQRGADVGLVVAMGPGAYSDYDEGAWVEIGDAVIFERYAGKALEVPGYKLGDWRLFPDIEVLAKVPREEP